MGLLARGPRKVRTLRATEKECRLVEVARVKARALPASVGLAVSFSVVGSR